VGCLKVILLMDVLINEQNLSVYLETFKFLFFLGKTSPLCFNVIPYILESNPHPNLIGTSFSRFLKRKKVSSQF